MNYYCKNKRIENKIKELQLSIEHDIWFMDTVLPGNSQLRDGSMHIIVCKGNAIRRMKKLKK